MNRIDLLEALGAAEDKDIQAAAGKLPAAPSPRKTLLRMGAAAAVVCLFVFAASRTLFGENRINTITMPLMQEQPTDSTESYSYDDAVYFTTTQSLYVGWIPNPFLSLPEEVPLLTDKDWEIPRERQQLYFVTSLFDDETSGMFHMIREVEKMYCRDHPEDPQINYAVYSPVYSVGADGTAAVREWISPDVYMGRIRGIFTITLPKYPEQMQAVYTKRDDGAEDWIARLEGLARCSSEKSPLCFLRDEQIGLIGLAGENAYLIRPAKGDPLPPSSITPARYVPNGEKLNVQRLDLSGTGIPVPYRAELTAEQERRYKDILISEKDNPFLTDYDVTGMSEEEIQKYFRKIMSDQSPAVTAANYLSRNVILSYDKYGRSVYREEYGGCYIRYNKLAVIIPTRVEGAEEYLTSLFREHFTDRVIFVYAEYSYNELREFQEKTVLPAFKEAGIRWYEIGPDEYRNCVHAVVSERDLVRCCELILEKGWVGRIRLERMDSAPVFTED